MRTRSLHVTLPICSAIIIASASTANAGDLNPPLGPIAPTMKNLDTVEPRIPLSAATTPGDADSIFKIVAPGSYYLTGNVVGIAGMRGIEIDAGGVTIDLMGFEMAGVAGALEGIEWSNVGTGTVTVRNGTIRGWPDVGVMLLGAEGALVEATNAHNNGLGGIVCESCVVSRCVTTDNGSAGIFVTDDCVVVNSLARGNGSHGIIASRDSTISSCTAEGNTDHGIFGVSGMTVTGSTANDNLGIGISIGSGSTVQGSTAIGNSDDGIASSLDSVIIACNAFNNGATGIDALSNCTVKNCAANSNGLHGIEVSSDSAVLNNTCDSNGDAAGSAGIHATSGGNRIEGNTLTDNNTTGVDVDAEGNLIIRNWFNGNTASIITTGTNLVGPLVTSGTIGAATNPTSNFEF